MVIDATDPSFDYIGRFDEAYPHLFTWAGMQVSFSVRANKMGVYIRNHAFEFDYFAVGVLVDGLQSRIELSNDDLVHRYDIPLGEDGIHEVTIFKRMGGVHYFEFLGVDLPAGGEIFQAPSQAETYRLLTFGDSICQGQCAEAVEYVGALDPDWGSHDKKYGYYDNAYYSFAAILARETGAQLHNIAQGRVALCEGLGYYVKCLPDIYDKSLYVPNDRFPVSSYNMQRFVPHVVLIAIGQNDITSYLPENTEQFKQEFCKTYALLLGQLQRHYPSAKFIIMSSIMKHDASLDELIESVARQHKVGHVKFARNGAATAGHPRISEQEEMAAEIAKFLKAEGVV